MTRKKKSGKLESGKALVKSKAKDISSKAVDLKKKVIYNVGGNIDDAVKKFREITFPIRDFIYLKENNVRIDEVWECRTHILAKVEDMCRQIRRDEWVTIGAYRRYLNCDTFLLVDGIDMEDELRFYKNAHEKFMEDWMSVIANITRYPNVPPVLHTLRYIKDILIAFKHTNIGYPYEYSKKEFHMIDNVESFSTNKVSFTYMNEMYDDEGELMTNEDCGLDWALYNKDIYCAYSAIANYLEWAASFEGISTKSAFYALDPDAAERLDGIIVESLTRAWKWIGTYIGDLWV